MVNKIQSPLISISCAATELPVCLEYKAPSNDVCFSLRALVSTKLCGSISHIGGIRQLYPLQKYNHQSCITLVTYGVEMVTSNTN